MGRKAGVYWDVSRNGWTTSSLGEERVGKAGKVFRLKVTNKDIPRDRPAEAKAWFEAELAKRRPVESRIPILPQLPTRMPTPLPPAGNARLAPAGTGPGFDEAIQLLLRVAEAWLRTELAKFWMVEAGPVGQITLPKETTPARVVIPTPSFDEAADAFLREALSSGRMMAEAHARSTEHVARFANFPPAGGKGRMGSLPVAQITPDQIQHFVSSLLDAGRSRSYVVGGILKTLRTFFNWTASVRPGSCPGLPLADNPIAQYKPPPKPRRAHRPVEAEQINAFFRWYWAKMRDTRGVNRRFRRIAGVLLLALHCTGARPKELCTATWPDWSLLPDGWGVIRLP